MGTEEKVKLLSEILPLSLKVCRLKNMGFLGSKQVRKVFLRECSTSLVNHDHLGNVMLVLAFYILGQLATWIFFPVHYQMYVPNSFTVTILDFG